MRQAWWKDVFRGLFGMLDGVIYGFISTVYTLLTEIAHFRIFDDITLQKFTTRIYAILGIIMLFKLSFSFINYMINPDAFTDKQKGVQNIVKNIVIMFVMLILSPWVFSKLWEIQGVILDEQVLARFVFGTVSSKQTNLKYTEECDDSHKLDNNEDKAGDFIATMVLRGFYRPYIFEEVFSDDRFIEDLKNEGEYSDTITALCRASTVGASSMLSSDIYNATLNPNTNIGKKYYVMEYHFGISTAVGVVVLLLLLNFCIDVGTRMVKLSFLQLIAPIPIISYIDPASGKNGMFQKWLKEVGKTWISVFIKLLAIFFSVSVIQHVGELIYIGKENVEVGTWVQIFVIIGALIFAKQLPDLIQNITGIKMEGGFNLNPFKKVENEALGGKFIANTARGTLMAGANMAVSGVGRMASNGYNFAKTRSNLKKAIAKEKDDAKKAKLQRQLDHMGFGRFMTTTSGGLTTGMLRGFGSGFSSGTKGNYNVFKNAKADIEKGNRARNNRANINDYNREIKYKAKEERQDFLKEKGVTRKGQLSKEDKKEFNNIKKDYKEQKYGFFERNIGERLDQWADVKNEYGGVGYYDKKISDLDKELNNNEARETAMRHAVSNYCANNNINQPMVEDFHKQYRKNELAIDSKFNEINNEKGQSRYNAKKAAETKSRYNAKKAAEEESRYNAKKASEEESRFNTKKDAEEESRYKEKVSKEGQERYVQKEMAEYQSRYAAKTNEEYQDRYNQKVTEEYNRILSENGGAQLSNDQMQQIYFNADNAAKKEIEQEVRAELTQEVEQEMRQEVEQEMRQEVEQEIRQEVEQEMLEVEQEIRQEVEQEMLEVEQKIAADVKQEMLEEAIRSVLGKDYQEILEEYGISGKELCKQYEMIKAQLEGISKVDDKNKELRRKKKEFTELLSARNKADKQ